MGRKYDELLDRVKTKLRAAGHTSLRTLIAERDALRVERVQLQAENESLRNDLARMPAGGPKLDDRDRELLTLSAGYLRGNNRDWRSDDLQAAHRLLCRLAAQPVEADEVARMEDEGGPAAPAEPDRAGWHGTWVAEQRETYGPGSKIKLKEGTKSCGGTVLNVEHEWHVRSTNSATHPREYAVFVGVNGAARHGFWIRPEDIAEVVK